MHRKPIPPGPPGHWFLGHLPEFRRDMLAFYSRLAREYGDVVSYRLGPRHAVLLTNPEHIEQVLVTESRNFIKSFSFRLLRPILGNGLLLNEAEPWLRQRRLIQPLFSRQQIDAHAPLMVDCAREMIDAWQPGAARDLHADMMRLALNIVTKTLLGSEVNDHVQVVSAAADAIMLDFNSRFQSAIPIPFWLPHPQNWRLKAQVRRLDAILEEIICRRRADSSGRTDLLSLLVRARDDTDKSGMSDAQLRDEVMTIFLAGHETTANVLSWTCFLIGRHPEIEEQLLAEYKTVLAGRAPTVADVPALKLTERVLLEAMRLYPPAYVIGRQPVRDCEIGGYRIRAGWTVMIPQWVVHRDPRYFDRPEAFDPDRWAEGRMLQVPKYAYFPFGGGPRICIGNSFAMLEAILALAVMVPRFHFRLQNPEEVVPWPSVTLRPQPGIKAVVEAR
ncbi:MAG: cytochrome P450 [Planctomycetes bacterium]|nr:cytochrome P450 [Planctomycetota bacterium]